MMATQKSVQAQESWHHVSQFLAGYVRCENIVDTVAGEPSARAKSDNPQSDNPWSSANAWK